MVETKKKNKTLRVIAVIIICILVISAVAGFSIFFSKKLRIERALERLDVEDENTVITVMKLDGDDPATVMKVVDAYFAAKCYTDASRLLLYYIQYLNPGDDSALNLLTECYTLNGADEAFLSQLITPLFKLSEFEVITELDGTGYGVADGIYTSFLGGTAKAKISAVLPLSMSACPSGVYVLDSSDNRLKLIRRDGSIVETVHTDKMTEFVSFESYLYYIDQNGMPHGPNEVTVEEGAIAMNLRVEDNSVVCTLYDADYNKIKDLILGL